MWRGEGCLARTSGGEVGKARGEWKWVGGKVMWGGGVKTDGKTYWGEGEG